MRPAITSLSKDTVVVFDIRYSSAHRYHLGLPENVGGVRLLDELLENLLRDAGTLLGRPIDRKKEHCFNYTGDGFVLVIRGAENQFRALRWISEFREKVSKAIKAYQFELKQKFPEIEAALKPLDFGIGAHTGLVKHFEFDAFGTTTKAFVGTAVNVASRVEQCTKDYAYKVICTGHLWNSTLRKEAEDFAQPLGMQRLRGFPKSYRLYSLKPRFHKACLVNP